MIYLFHGSDTARARAKAFAWVEAARKKAPGAAYLRIAADTVTVESLAEAAEAAGLFFPKILVLLDDPFSLKESGEAVLEALPRLVQSENPIAILAPKLHPAHAKKIEAKAAKVFKTDAKEKFERGFNAPLVNALGARDGKTLWKEITKAFREGDAPEMIHGLLHWKARDLMQKGGKAWSKEEARGLSVSLIELLSDSRRGDLELSLALERFALSF